MLWWIVLNFWRDQKREVLNCSTTSVRGRRPKQQLLVFLFFFFEMWLNQLLSSGLRVVGLRMKQTTISQYSVPIITVLTGRFLKNTRRLGIHNSAFIDFGMAFAQSFITIKLFSIFPVPNCESRLHGHWRYWVMTLFVKYNTVLKVVRL